MRRPARLAPSAERLIAHNLVVGVSTVASGALGFFMQAILSHQLMRADYGTTFTLLSLLIVIWLPSNAVMLVIAQTASGDPEGERSAAIMWRWHRQLLIAGFIIAVASIVGANWLGRFFHVPSAAIVPAALSLPFGLVLPILLGQLQGEQRFTRLASLLVGQAALRTLLATVFAVRFGALGVLVGIAAANIFIYLAALAMVRRPAPGRRPLPAESKAALRSLALILPGSLALALLFGADILLVKHYFSASTAGLYAAMAALGRAIFWGATGVALVLFPKVAAQASRGHHARQLVMGSMGLCLLGGILGLSVLSLGSRLLLTAFAGAAYAEAAVYLPWYALAMTLLGAASVLVANAQAQSRSDVLGVLLPVTLLEPLLIAGFHQSLGQIVAIVLGSMALLVAGLAAVSLRAERRRARPVIVLEGATA